MPTEREIDAVMRKLPAFNRRLHAIRILETAERARDANDHAGLTELVMKALRAAANPYSTTAGERLALAGAALRDIERQAGAALTPTPEMIEAGVEVFVRYDPDGNLPDEAVAEIWHVMCEARDAARSKDTR